MQQLLGRRQCRPATLLRGSSAALRGASWMQSMSTAPLAWDSARFGGATLAVDAPVEADFEARLELALAEIQAAGRRGIWLTVPIEHAEACAVASRHGFAFHSAEGGTSTLLRWLPDGPSPVPPFATHIVGVGGLVMNDKREVLCVREARTPTDQPTRTNWKLPGGLMDLGEEVGDAAAREVFEETGVRAQFQSLISMRVQHGAAFGRDDFYLVACMEPLTEEINLSDQDEIAECAWLPLAEYVASTEELAAERGVGDTMNSWLMRNVAIEVEAGNHPKEWGWASTALEAGGAKSAKHITGWGDRAFYNMFTPKSFLPPRGLESQVESVEDIARKRRIARLLAEKNSDEPTDVEIAHFEAGNQKLRPK